MPLRVLLAAAAGVLALQLGALVVESAYLYRRFDLGEDFAHVAQAWFLIGHGAAGPLDTVRIPPTPYLQDHFELVLWPLSLLHFAVGSPFVLLVVADLALVATEAVALLWVAQLCRARFGRIGAFVFGAALVVLVANPWWYEAASFPLHLGTFGLPWVLGCAWALWAGHRRWAWAGAGVALLCGVVTAELLAVLSVAALASGQVRRASGWREPAAIGVVAAAWTLVVSALGANQASNLAAQFGYLAGPGASPGMMGVLRGIVARPATAFSQLSRRAPALGRLLVTSGGLGVLSLWGALAVLGVAVPAALAASPVYSSLDAGFQTLPVVPIVVVGSVMVLGWLVRTSLLGSRAVARTGVLVAAGLLALTAVAQSARLLETIPSAWWRVDSGGAAVLSRGLAQVAPSAQVIAAEGVMGRFALRRQVYPLVLSPQEIPVRASVVDLVLTASQGVEALTPAQVAKDAAFAHTVLHARVVAQGAGVSVLVWHPPPGTTAVRFP